MNNSQLYRLLTNLFEAGIAKGVGKLKFTEDPIMYAYDKIVANYKVGDNER